MKQEPAESALVQTKPGFVGILAFFNGGEDVQRILRKFRCEWRTAKQAIFSTRLL